MKRNLSLPLVVLLLCSLLLGACSPNAATTAVPTAASTSETNTQPTDTGQPVAANTLVPTSWVPVPYSGGVKIQLFMRLSAPGAMWPTIVDGFNKANAGKIYATLTYTDDTTYITKLPIVLRSDTPPDVFFSWMGGRAKMLVAAGYAEPLDRYYTQFGWNTLLTTAAIGIANNDGVNGHIYEAPYYMSASAVWYRSDILKKYNLSVPTTWDELQNVCQTLKDNKIYCWMISNKDGWEAQFDWTGIFVQKYGLQAYKDLINRKIPFTDPRVVDAFQVLKDFADKYAYPNPNSVALMDGSIPFAQGTVAFWYQGSWMPGLFGYTGGTFEYDFMPFPTFPGITPTQELWAEETLMVNANSTHKDEAAQFIDYVLSQPVQTIMAQNNQFPSNKNVDLSVMNNPSLVKLGQVMAATGAATYVHPDIALNDAVSSEFLNDIQAVLAGAMTPAQAGAASEANAVKEAGPVVP